MKTTWIYAMLLALAGYGTARAQTAGSEFDWLLGRWEGKLGSGDFHESWTKGADGRLQGEGYFVRGSDTLQREQLLIQPIATYWTYIPVIDGKPPVLFTLVENKAGYHVFENREHDFPQRVVYTRMDDGSMLAWIEGTLNGAPRKMEYRLQKMKEKTGSRQ